VHRSFKFCLLTIGSNIGEAGFSFFLGDAAQLAEPERRFTLSPEQIAAINPNTKTAPVFRSRGDAELTARIYSRVPILIDETKGREGNLWRVASYTRIWHMAEDSSWFRTADQLLASGYERDSGDWVIGGLGRHKQTLVLNGGRGASVLDLLGESPRASERYVPLYEAKMIHQFDHRWATYDGTDSRNATEAEKRDPAFEATPRYWVPEREVINRLSSKGWARGWLVGWRKISRATDERSLIASVFPKAAAGDSLPLCLPDVDGCELLASWEICVLW